MSLYDIDLTTLEGKPQTMAVFRGKTLLIVNVASHCGYTSQYAGLQALHEQYKDRGFAVLGFPCDQFGHQEPGTEAEIASFCERNYGVSFPMYAKTEVNGANAHPLYQLLKSGRGGSDPIKWNFTKFLVGPDGTVEKRYASGDTPEAIGKELAARLK
jgi:glutathione peroxidase